MDSLKKDIQNEIDEAFDFAEKSKFPESDELYKNIYTGL